MKIPAAAIIRGLRKVSAISVTPWQKSMTLDPLAQLLNAPEILRNEKTRDWKDAKLAELSFIGLTVTN